MLLRESNVELTLTVAEAVVLLPASSRTVIVVVVVPRGSSHAFFAMSADAHGVPTTPERLSVAVQVRLTVWSSEYSTLPANVTTGAVMSTHTAADLAASALPALSSAKYDTLYWPSVPNASVAAVPG